MGKKLCRRSFWRCFGILRLGRPKDNLRGWIFRVAHNLSLKTRETEQTRPDRAEFDEEIAAAHVDPQPNPEQQLSAGQRQTRLMATVRALPERDQYCLHLRAEGLRYREIAEILEMSLGAVVDFVEPVAGAAWNARTEVETMHHFESHLTDEELLLADRRRAVWFARRSRSKSIWRSAGIAGRGQQSLERNDFESGGSAARRV